MNKNNLIYFNLRDFLKFLEKKKNLNTFNMK